MSGYPVTRTESAWVLVANFSGADCRVLNDRIHFWNSTLVPACPATALSRHNPFNSE